MDTNKVDPIRHGEDKVESRMDIGEIVNKLCEIQEELQIKGYEEAAQLIHRACNKVSTIMLRQDLSKRMGANRPGDSE